MIFMGLILKIPVVFACWLLWWAFRAEPEPAEAEDDGGGIDRRFRREPKPKRPRGPRRGPHAPDSLPLPCPEESASLRVVRRPRPALVPAGTAREPRRR